MNRKKDSHPILNFFYKFNFGQTHLKKLEKN